MQSVLVSSCLLGELVRYDGTDKKCDHEILKRWLSDGRIVSVCPEIAGGLPVPRPSAEITNGAGGVKVLKGEARVVSSTAQDFSTQFICGAQRTLELARTKNICVAVLKEGSPSCGSSFTYDGTFSTTKVGKPGVTTATLRQAGIQVFNENQLADADSLLMQLEAKNAA